MNACLRGPEKIVKVLKEIPAPVKMTAGVVILFLFPLIDTNTYHQEVLTTAGIYAILALGLNVVVGFAGLLNLGYAAFFAIGAYTYALLNLNAGVPFWAGLPVSIIVCGFSGLVRGFPTLRLRGDYLAIVTLGFGEIVRIALNNLDTITGGPNGLLGIAHPNIVLWKSFNFGVLTWPYYYLVIVMAVLTAMVVKRLENSRLGRAWVAIREDEVAANAMGIDTTWTKLLAFIIGAAIAGLAGAVFAAKQGTVSPDSFDFILSVMVLAMVVLGGLGSVPGVILGAVVLSLLPELLRGLPGDWTACRMLFFGLAMLVIMLFRPQGLIGTLRMRSELRPVYEQIKLEEDEVLEEDREK